MRTKIHVQVRQEYDQLSNPPAPAKEPVRDPVPDWVRREMEKMLAGEQPC